jgi:RNA polymerase sigma-70 factor, ECF subfamily
MRENTLALALAATSVNSESQPQSDDAFALIEQARSGDMSAFDLLMRRHERLVLMTSLRCLNGNMADAQDAAQTVFLRLHRSLGQFRADASFPAWLYRITVNVCHDINRRTQRRAEVELDAGVHQRCTVPANDEVALDIDRQRQAVTAGLSQLGNKERAAIVLRDIEGLGTREVASILGSSEATVRSQISGARRKIRKFAQEYMRRRS